MEKKPLTKHPKTLGGMNKKTKEKKLIQKNLISMLLFHKKLAFAGGIHQFYSCSLALNQKYLSHF